WIGRRVWPLPRLLVREAGGVRDRRLLDCSLFLDPPDRAGRLWAIDVALRCPAVIAVIADGSGLRMAETRRLQLAAEAGRSCERRAVNVQEKKIPGAGGELPGVGLLVRPENELKELSAATTRWLVHPVATTHPHSPPRPRWTVRLLRNKAAPLAGDEEQTWLLEWDDHVQGIVHPSAEVVGGSDPASESPAERSCAGEGPPAAIRRSA
ncbi:MAG: hypothetical protein JSV91_13605, partial [Phycisphaerales bacterium]